MNFELACDDYMDGLVLIDESYLKDFDDCLLYAMDILLDMDGTSELIYDFPGEEWAAVRARETKSVREFCGGGANADSCRWLHVPTGRLLGVSASELIQRLPYPELEMEKMFELELAKGWYAISNENMDKIMYQKGNPKNSPFENIQEL